MVPQTIFCYVEIKSDVMRGQHLANVPEMKILGNEISKEPVLHNGSEPPHLKNANIHLNDALDTKTSEREVRGCLSVIISTYMLITLCSLRREGDLIRAEHTPGSERPKAAKTLVNIKSESIQYSYCHQFSLLFQMF